MPVFEKNRQRYLTEVQSGKVRPCHPTKWAGVQQCVFLWTSLRTLVCLLSVIVVLPTHHPRIFVCRSTQRRTMIPFETLNAERKPLALLRAPPPCARRATRTFSQKATGAPPMCSTC